MSRRLSILCPIDFSAASLGALRHAAAIAEHRQGQLTVATVDDPLLASMDAAAGQVSLGVQSRRELARVVADVLGPRGSAFDVKYEVGVGRPSDEILRIAQDHSADMIVMSSHGLTGLRKMFFGSTTERVLRDSRVPVLVTGPGDLGPASPGEMNTFVNRILVPVDLDQASGRLVQIAASLATQLSVPLLLVHVVEPARLPFPRRAEGPRLDRERRAQADEAMDELAHAVPAGVTVETLVAYGEPPEEIAKVARDRHAGLIVIPLRASAAHGAQMGSVAYRVLCLAPAMVLALPASTIAQGKDQLGYGTAALSIV